MAEAIKKTAGEAVRNQSSPAVTLETVNAKLDWIMAEIKKMKDNQTTYFQLMRNAQAGK